MGCETDVPPEQPEAERSRVVTSAEIECGSERVYPISVIIYNRPAATQNRNNTLSVDNSKMATENTADLGATDNEEISKSEESNISDKENSKQTVTVDSSDNEKSHNDIEQAPPVESQPENTDACASCREDSVNDKVIGEVLTDLNILMERLETSKDIPPILFDVSLNCLKPGTIDYLSYHLDPESDIMSPEDRLKDYRGLAEWIGLEPIFIKYISRSPHVLKTKEVLSKWLTREEEPLPTIQNLRKCLLAIDRPDVLEDMSVKMARDAATWKKTLIEAKTQRQVETEDTSWQLTRHDVVSGKPTYYTCCLVYADEDEGMIQVFTKLYKTVYPSALFFLPQFDLKHGKFIYDTTAQVIEERCHGKVIFFLSEYFFASPVCRFTVNFCKEMDSSANEGNMIPFNLTNKYEHVPRVLKGIAGIRWFRKQSRKRHWLMLTDSLLGGKMTAQELEQLKVQMEAVIDKDREYYLSDPPYDEDTPQPGDPISVYDPEPEVENSDDPSARHFDPEEDECLMSRSLTSLEAMGYAGKRSNLTRVAHYVRKKIFQRVFGSGRERRRAPIPSSAHRPPIEIPRHR